MRIDFHFYTIYSLARLAGFKPDDGYTIAYASQYTDDAVNERTILFENDDNGFDEIMTSHKIMDPTTLLDRTCRMVWVPFHFLPGNEGNDFFERMVTRADGIIAKEIIKIFMDLPILPYSLHLLGIILHAYADTFSHQNFLGVKHHMNNVSELRILNEGLSESPPVDIDLLNLGHVQAGHIPDEPYVNWEYNNYKGEKLTISNMDRTFQAAKNCHDLLVEFFNKLPNFIPSQIMNWEKNAIKLKELFNYSGSIEECEKLWKSAISNGDIGFVPSGRDLSLSYNDTDWFNDAINQETRIAENYEYIGFEKKAGFDSSDWKHFNEAASFYRSAIFLQICNEKGLGINNI